MGEGLKPLISLQDKIMRAFEHRLFAFGHFLVVIASLVLIPVTAIAQTAQRGRLTITVVDPSGAVIPEATVTLVGLETPTKATTLPPTKTTDKGVAIFEGLALGRYSVRAEFPGFEMGLLRDFRVNRGENRHAVV